MVTPALFLVLVAREKKTTKEKNKSMKRHSDALAISAGACNIAGMARSLVEACDEIGACGQPLADDPAIKLIVSQIAYIAGIWDGISDWPCNARWDFADATKACREASQQPIVKTVNGCPVIDGVIVSQREWREREGVQS